MDRLCFNERYNWYRGNLHSHTVNSDGELTPEESVKLYKNCGYSFICLSEHDYYTDLSDGLNTEDFILLPGVEASAWLLNAGGKRLIKTHHIHGIMGNYKMQEKAAGRIFRHGEKLDPPKYFGSWDGLKAAQELSDSLKERGCFTIYNHPNWSRVEMSEVAGLCGLTAVEVYNYGTAVECGEGYDTVYWESMLRRGTRLCCTASDDNHNKPWLFDSAGGWICVNASELSHEAIVNAIMDGCYYSSSGPAIYRWGVDSGCVFVECSDAEKINFIAGGRVGLSETRLARSCPLKSARHRLSGEETYVRVECVDFKGRTAWTNPIWLCGE